MEATDDHFIEVESFNETESEKFTLTKFPVTKSVRELKVAIAERVGDGCRPEDLTVTYGSQELKDDETTLASYNIQNGDTVDFLFFTVADLERELLQTLLPTLVSAGTEKPREVIPEMMFADFNGPTLILRAVPVDYTVAEMRRKLLNDYPSHSNDRAALRFLWKGKQLEDDKKLLDYGNKEELKRATIQIVSRLRGGQL